MTPQNSLVTPRNSPAPAPAAPAPPTDAELRAAACDEATLPPPAGLHAGIVRGLRAEWAAEARREATRRARIRVITLGGFGSAALATAAAIALLLTSPKEEIPRAAGNSLAQLPRSQPGAAVPGGLSLPMSAPRFETALPNFAAVAANSPTLSSIRNALRNPATDAAARIRIPAPVIRIPALPSWRDLAPPQDAAPETTPDSAGSTGREFVYRA